MRKIYQASLSGTITLPKSLITLERQCFIHPGGDFNIKFESGSQLKEIPFGAFADMDNTNGLRHITLPASLESIGKQAFYNCDLMTSVTFEEGSMTTGAKTIEDNAFDDCDSLSTIYAYQDTITAMGWSASGTQSFYGAANNVTVINREVTTFTYGTININHSYNDTSDVTLTTSSYDSIIDGQKLKAIHVGLEVTSISNNAFKDLDQMYTLTFDSNSNLETIGNSAFNGVTQLMSTIIPASVTSIGELAFYNCTQMTSFTFEENSSLTTIQLQTFSGCTNLASIEIVASVKNINNLAFYNCTQMTSFTFEENSQLETIGAATFYNSGLTGPITFPASLKTIGTASSSSGTFENCSNSFSILFEAGSVLETIEQYSFKDSDLTGTITLPASLKTIGKYAFHNCSSLNTVTFEQNSLTAEGSSFGTNVFYGSGLTTINAYQTTITAMGGDSTNQQTIGGKSVTVNILT